MTRITVAPMSTRPRPPTHDPVRASTLLGGLVDGSRGRLRHVEELPERPARVAEWPDWVDPIVANAFRGAGVDRLWSHQRQAMDLVRAGHHTVLSTGTASGKSLGYLVPVLSDVAEGARTGRGRAATAVYLAPTKALAADQRDRIERMAIPGVRAATLDGDTPSDERRWIREHANVILTNPDLLHHSLLPGHEHWASFLRGLRYVVVDECHSYRGVFGSHVAAVLRRLRRVAARYRSEPVFVLASATIADPADHATGLIGMPVQAVQVDGSPRGALTFALWEPAPLPGGQGEVAPDGSTPRRVSASTEAADLLAGLVRRDVQTVAFARSRAGVEAVATRARRQIAESDPERGDRIRAYRGGYLPEERRQLERDVRSGEILGLAATNALELGVDITGLDAVLVAGWPGRRASLWQQVGRAGRSGQDALAVFVAADDPLDNYVLDHPGTIFGEPVERAVLDPHNLRIIAPHIAAAAAELPLTDEELDLFGPRARDAVDALVAAGILRRRPRGWYWAREDRAGDHVDLRGIGSVVSIVDRSTGRVVGTVDEAAAHVQVHTGAVHVHQGQSWVVTELDLESATALAVRGDPGWTTQAQTESTFRIIRSTRHSGHGPLRVSVGDVEVSGRVTGFLRRLPGGEVIGRHPLELPARTLATRAVWWTLEEDALAAADVGAERIPGSAHAAEHAAIGLLPLLAMCDRWDIGGVSTALHPDTGLPTVMVYDGYPGGAGFADRAHAMLPTWLRATRETVAGCECPRGCPACVQSPKCGNGNDPLDKAGAVALLELTLRALAT